MSTGKQLRELEDGLADNPEEDIDVRRAKAEILKLRAETRHINSSQRWKDRLYGGVSAAILALGYYFSFWEPVISSKLELVEVKESLNRAQNARLEEERVSLEEDMQDFGEREEVLVGTLDLLEMH